MSSREKGWPGRGHGSKLIGNYSENKTQRQNDDIVGDAGF